VTPETERRARLETWKQRVSSVFANVEHVLSTNVDKIEKDARNAAYVGASYLLVRDLVSKSVADMYWSEPRAEGRLANWLTTIGETLFALKDSDCLFEFCSRMAVRGEPRSAFYEAFAARLFSDLDFFIFAINETGKRGDDFDFTAIRQGSGFVCVEVTCLQPKGFSPNTVQNALKAKRGQVRPDQANVIVMVLPDDWLNDPTAPSTLRNVTENFYRSSRRINLVLYLGEAHSTVETPAGEMSVMQYKVMPVYNAKPRTPCPALLFFRAFAAVSRDISQDPDLADTGWSSKAAKNVESRPFFQWVNNALGRSQ
jgi:hypothetical protein